MPCILCLKPHYDVACSYQRGIWNEVFHKKVWFACNWNAVTWLWVQFLRRGGGVGIRFSLGPGPRSLLGPRLLSASCSPPRLCSYLPESTASVTCLDSAVIRVCDRLLQPWESSTHSVFVLAFLYTWLWHLGACGMFKLFSWSISMFYVLKIIQRGSENIYFFYSPILFP